MGKYRDLTGQKFGKLTAISDTNKRARGGAVVWLCKCDCGNLKEISAQPLTKGETQSCGCINKEKSKNRNTYEVWFRLKEQCLNPKNSKFHYYGGKGIEFYLPWVDFKIFLKDLGHKPKGSNLTRIDKNKGFIPGNVVWRIGKYLQLEIGSKFNNLTVTKKGKNNGNQFWWFKCDCGNEKEFLGSAVKNGKIKSCGCLSDKTTHGMSKTKIYAVWNSMIQRCYTPSSTSYKRYGAIGIRVCNEWRENFLNFYRDMGDIPKGKTLDRIDSKKDYYKENCKWSTPKEQARNTRRNRMITYNGRTQCMQAWADETGINEKVIWYRLDKGWTVKDTLTT